MSDLELERPDLSELPEAVVAYIEALEAALGRKRAAGVAEGDSAESPFIASEPETTEHVITISRSGVAKRTPRHLYGRQRRAGMGVFDLDSDEDDPPAHLVIADIAESIILFTDHGRAYRVAVRAIADAPVRGRGASITDGLKLRPGERVVAALRENGGVYATLVSQRGWIRHVRSGYLGTNLIQGSTFHNISEGGYLAAACWTSGEDDILMATRSGLALRFSERQVPARGCLGIRITPDDAVVAVTGVAEEDGVFLVSDDGKGTTRLMSGFRQNKAPGAGGKVAMKTDNLVGALRIRPNDDAFLISRLGKIIRFALDEVPPKEGVVQGVICMNLRGDTVTAVTTCPRPADA